MQIEIECVNKYKSFRQIATRLRICVGTQRRKHHVYVFDPFSNRWTHGFISYDGKGIVYYSPRARRYIFSGIIVESARIGSRLYGRGGFKYSLPFEFRLQKGIQAEKRIYENLKSVDSKFHIHHLERSGLKSHGTDIVISKQKELYEDPFETVRNGVCAIEVLGVRVRNRNCKPIFTYHYNKNFYVWRQELLDNDILPIIAWNQDDNCNYAVLSNDVLFNGFWIEHKGDYHQQTGNVPVSRISNYSISVYQLFDCLEWHLKTIKIIKKIKDKRPIRLGDIYLYSPSYRCEDPFMYDMAINRIKKYGF